MAFEEFNPTRNYSAGKFIWKDSNLFQFIKDHPAGRWTGNDVKLVSGKRLVNMIEDEEQKEASKSEVLQPTETGSIVTPITSESQTPSALSVGIEPVQDLNGYDAPWPAGGGKNLFQTTATTQTVNLVTFTVNDDGSVKASGTASANTNFRMGSVTLEAGTYIINGITSGSLSTYYIQVVSEDETTQLYLCYTSPVTMTFSETTTIVLRYRVLSGIAVSATIYPMIRLSSESDATFAPYSNVCPISGHTQAVVTRTGKNLLPTGNIASTTINDVTIVNNGDGTFNVSGTSNAAFNFVLHTSQQTLPKTFEGAILSGGVSSNVQVCLTFYNDSNIWLGALISQTTEKTISIPNGATKYTIGIRYGAAGASYTGTIYPMIRLASETDDTYEAYTGTSVTIDLGGTRYGGTLDVLTGELTVDRMAQIVTGDVTRLDDNRCYFDISEDSETNTSASTIDDSIISDMFPNVSVTTSLTSPGVLLRANGSHQAILSVNGSDISLLTTDAWNTWLADNPVTVCYKLATPTTVTLTAETLAMLGGENVVWASTGDTTITYRADTKAYIDKLFTALQALALEN